MGIILLGPHDGIKYPPTSSLSEMRMGATVWTLSRIYSKIVLR